MKGDFLIAKLTDNDALYSIGALSKMVGISADTLRYYDEIGLFKPAQTSRETGYRYYTIDQAAALAQIMELKQYGFSLNEIKKIVSQGEIAFTDVYLNRYWALENEKKKLQETINKLSEKIKQRQEGFVMDKKILIVDDASFMRLMCKDFLTREGYDVVGEACDGLEAVELYKSLKPDMVLLDIVMPNCDGINALRKIKEYDENVCAVMISAMSQARMITESLLAGAQDFLVKPFQAEGLLRAVRDSFHPTNAINYEIAQQIHDATVDDMYILSAQEVDMMMKIICSQADVHEVESTIARLKERSPAEQQGYDPTIEQRAHIIDRLEKLEQGQEEILHILTYTYEKTD